MLAHQAGQQLRHDARHILTAKHKGSGAIGAKGIEQLQQPPFLALQVHQLSVQQRIGAALAEHRDIGRPGRADLQCSGAAIHVKHHRQRILSDALLLIHLAVGFQNKRQPAQSIQHLFHQVLRQRQVSLVLRAHLTVYASQCVQIVVQQVQQRHLFPCVAHLLRDERKIPAEGNGPLLTQRTQKSRDAAHHVQARFAGAQAEGQVLRPAGQRNLQLQRFLGRNGAFHGIEQRLRGHHILPIEQFGHHTGTLSHQHSGHQMPAMLLAALTAGAIGHTQRHLPVWCITHHIGSPILLGTQHTHARSLGQTNAGLPFLLGCIFLQELPGNHKTST